MDPRRNMDLLRGAAVERNCQEGMDLLRRAAIMK
jgi:hypothetical protein